MSEWKPGTVYVRHTTDGKGSIQSHTCWNTGRFIESLTANYAAVNAKRKEAEPEVGFKIVSRTEYFAERGFLAHYTK